MSDYPTGVSGLGLPRYVVAFLRHMEIHKDYLKWNIVEGSHKLTLTLTWNFRKDKETLWGKIRKSLKFGGRRLSADSAGCFDTSSTVPQNLPRFTDGGSSSDGEGGPRPRASHSATTIDGWYASERHAERRKQQQAARQNLVGQGSSPSLHSQQQYQQNLNHSRGQPRRISSTPNAACSMYVGPGGDGRCSSASNHGGGGSNHGGGNHGDYETLSMAGFQRHVQSFSSYHTFPSCASVGIPVAPHKGARAPSSSTIAISRRTREIGTSSSPSHASWHGTSFDALSAEDRIDHDMHDVTLTSSPIGSPPSSPWSTRRDKIHGEEMNGGGSEVGWRRIDRDDPTDGSLLVMTWRPGELTPEQSSEGNEGSSAVTAVGDGYRAYVRTTSTATAAAAAAASTATDTAASSACYSAAMPSTNEYLATNTSISGNNLQSEPMTKSTNKIADGYSYHDAVEHGKVVRCKSNSWFETGNVAGVESSTYDGMLLNDLPEFHASNSDIITSLQASSSDVTTPLIGSAPDFAGTLTSEESCNKFNFGSDKRDRDMIGLRKSTSNMNQPSGQRLRTTADQLMQSMDKLHVLEEYGRSASSRDQLGLESYGTFRSREQQELFQNSLGIRKLIGHDDGASGDLREHRKSMEHLGMHDELFNSMDRLKSSLAFDQHEQVSLENDESRDLKLISEAAAAAVNQTVLKCLDSCDKILFRHSTTL